ncbi:YHYH protein [bacterium]|nr:YHYH protein [bacterium]
MKFLLSIVFLFFLGIPAEAHDLSGLGYDPHGKPPDLPTSAGTNTPSGLARIFAPFAPAVSTREDGRYLYVSSTGFPDHPMMKGIRNWQQQIPIPQDYSGQNSWRLPLQPVPASSPAMIRGRFLRGAIALAANGVPIFNPQNNRGEIALEIGELDEWGGHCGRADDYHYHVAPLHLQEKVGSGQPVAVALDGYPVYGLTDPDGSSPKDLDACHGHETQELGYHYHASKSYPYVLGGFHGEVTERGEQVDPQPRAQPFRPAGEPLRGAEITDFQKTGPDAYELTYRLNGQTWSILYSINGQSLRVETKKGNQLIKNETYERRGPPPRPPR